MFAADDLTIPVAVLVAIVGVGFAAILAGIGAIFMRLRSLETGLAVAGAVKVEEEKGREQRLSSIEQRLAGLAGEVGKVHGRIDGIMKRQHQDDPD